MCIAHCAINIHISKQSASGSGQINNSTVEAKSGEQLAVIVFLIESLQNQLRDGIDESANVTDLERAKSTMRKSRQKVGGT